MITSDFLFVARCDKYHTDLGGNTIWCKARPFRHIEPAKDNSQLLFAIRAKESFEKEGWLDENGTTMCPMHAKYYKREQEQLQMILQNSRENKQ
jgi:hypothetical protein